MLTNDERNHRRPVAPSGFQALDQLLHLPYLDILLRVVLLLLRRAHDGRGEVIFNQGKRIWALACRRLANLSVGEAKNSSVKILPGNPVYTPCSSQSEVCFGVKTRTHLPELELEIQ